MSITAPARSAATSPRSNCCAPTASASSAHGKPVMPMPEWLRIRRDDVVLGEDAAQWTKCPKCGEMLYRPDLAASLYVCKNCGQHFRMHAFDRISMLIDSDFV